MSRRTTSVFTQGDWWSAHQHRGGTTHLTEARGVDRDAVGVRAATPPAPPSQGGERRQLLSRWQSLMFPPLAKGGQGGVNSRSSGRGANVSRSVSTPGEYSAPWWANHSGHGATSAA